MGQLADMAARSVRTTKEKGFRRDWEDAAWLELLAADRYLGLGDEERENLRRIARQHRALLFGTKLALVMSECAEALEEVRDHGIEAVVAGGTGFGQELADVHIRLFDLEDLAGVDAEAEIATKQEKNEGRPHMHGRRF